MCGILWASIWFISGPVLVNDNHDNNNNNNENNQLRKRQTYKNKYVFFCSSLSLALGFRHATQPYFGEYEESEQKKNWHVMRNCIGGGGGVCVKWIA